MSQLEFLIPLKNWVRFSAYPSFWPNPPSQRLREEVRGETRNLLRFHPALAPVKVAVFPLVKKDGMPEIARRIYDDLKGLFNCFYDEKGAVGRRYRRQDEAGTPFCVTVDGQTKEDNTVTVRDRDSMDQIHVSTDQLKSHLRDKLNM